jgi:beta-barrel assembly-enhancing protease
VKERARLIGLAVLLLTGGVLAAAVSIARVQPPLSSSLAPAFTLLGAPVHAVDHLATRVMPVGDLDERALGAVLRARLDASHATTDRDAVYVNEVMRSLTIVAEKPFDYRVYIMSSDDPNAMALPGGVVFVTSGLLEVLESEAELAAVLAHELGHIELSHCLDAVKFRLLAEKIGQPSLGEVVDFAATMLVRHSFSKAQEDAADEYAYALLTRSVYDPRGLEHAFGSLRRYVTRHELAQQRRRGADPVRDYFMSHPPLEVREAKFRERADTWWRRNPHEQRVSGEESRSASQVLATHVGPGAWGVAYQLEG